MNSPPDRGALLVVGATSGAGKSTTVAALGRLLRRHGRNVAPFKAQNMSNHAAVTADGGEIGRAQATQAAACGIDFERRMNPILLKPTSNRQSHIVVMGDEVSITDAVGYGPTTNELKPIVLRELNQLRSDFDWVVAEGAGGAGEINLLDRDLVNLPLAAAAGLKTLLVVDIDVGGAYASAFGTIQLVPQHLRDTIGGVVFNRFRGDPSLLESGNVEFERRTGVPILGVLPALDHPPILGVEDSMDITVGPTPRDHSTADLPQSSKPVRVVAIRLPHLSNPSDLDPFTIEPDVTLRWAVRPDDLAGADVIVVPGSRATVADLDWMADTGIADRLSDYARHEAGVIIGVCGGYQILGRTIDDELESGRGRVEGLGLLDTHTVFAAPKVVRRSHGTTLYRSANSATGATGVGSAVGVEVSGYQIRWGRPSGAATAWLDIDGESEGAVSDHGSALVMGTSLHGIFDHDQFRSDLLTQVADRCDRSYRPSPVTLAEAMSAQHDRLAYWLEEYSQLDRILALGAEAVTPGTGPGW